MLKVKAGAAEVAGQNRRWSQEHRVLVPGFQLGWLRLAKPLSETGAPPLPSHPEKADPTRCPPSLWSLRRPLSPISGKLLVGGTFSVKVKGPPGADRHGLCVTNACGQGG